MPAADLCEVFTSVQGEGIFVGRRQLFVRFACCNLNCPYCDTKYALFKPPVAKFENSPFSGKFYEERNPVPAFTLNEYINLYFTLDPTIHSISLTGGEPLLQDEFLEFFLRSYKNDHIFHLETNGSLPDKLEKVIDFIDFVSMDIKLFYLNTPSFFESQRKFLKIASKKAMQVKIVVSETDSMETFRMGLSVLKDADKDVPVIIQPDTKAMPDSLFLAQLQKEAGTQFKNVLVIPQIHPFLGIK